MRWREAHQEAMIAAADAHDELAVDTFARIDVFTAMTPTIKLMFKPLDGRAALYLPSVLGSRPGALINSQHPLALQRYSGAHEFGHHRFDHGAQIDKNVELRLSGQTLPPHEMLAEAFAAWFLMPPERADIVLESLAIIEPTTPIDVYAMALRFGTSYSATCVHLPSLKKAREAAVREWLRVPLKKVKQSLTTTPPPGGWANDVWSLTVRDSAETLVVRAGDRLLFHADASVERLPAGASVGDNAPPDLLTPARTVLDLSPDMDSGPATLTLTVGTSTISFTLAVERRREGLYVPALTHAAA